MLLQVRNGCFRYGDATVFDNVNLELNEGDSVGVVGANGAGKTTLLSCLLQEAPLFSGEIFCKNGLSVGYLRQHCDFTSTNTLYKELESVFDRQKQLLVQLDNTAQQLAQVPFQSAEYRNISEKYHKLTLQAEAEDAYKVEVTVKTVINGMGMAQFSERIVDTLSGGEKTKAALCKLLLQRPELLVLDEPTNHLDYKALDWLENFLLESKSALIIVSHDRYFLDKVCTSIWDVGHQKVECYKGNYTKYKVLKAERQENLRRQYEKQQKEIEKLTDYIARNKVRASTADMAKSREKTLQKMQQVEAPQAEERPPHFNFVCTSQPSEFPLTIRNLQLRHGQNMLAQDIELQLRRGDKVALLGLNGTGKSTLMRLIAENDPLLAGKVVFGKNVRMGYYDQENLNLLGNLRVLDQLWFDNTRMSQTQVRSLLAAVNLRGDDAYKLVSVLSGGERAKLGLAMIMAKDCNLLLLDEPTNHLDLPSREALENALRQFEGTVLFVSHDRYFVNSIAGCVAELDNGKITLTQGNYDSYIASKSAAKASVQPKQTAGNFRSAKQRAAQTNKARELKQIEEKISQVEQAIAELNNKLSQSEVVSDYTKLQEVLQNLQQQEQLQEQLLAQWETLAE